MAESTITAKGQTTVPQQIRDALGAESGARLAWHVLSDGTVVVRAKTKSILDLAGSLTPRKGSKRVTVKQMRS
jgi:bifunctional DNA-binding transcriptional regulator/antitoxin component of YhaV-PrlF toxin-antitoxin module